MKKKITNYIILKYLFLSFIFIAPLFKTAYSQKIKFQEINNKTGFTLKQEKTNSVKLIYSLKEFDLNKKNIDGEEMQNIEISGSFLPNDEGAPNLPSGSKYIAIPKGAKVNLKITSFKTEKFSDVNLAPAPKIPLANDNSPLKFKKNKNIYSNDAFYPAKPVVISKQLKVRGVDAVIIGVTPFQYNAVTKELIAYKNIEIELEFIGGNGQYGEERLHSRWWDPILENLFINSNSIPKVKKSKSYRAQGCEYLIVTPDDPDFIAWADTIKNWRTLQGIKTDVVTTTQMGGNTTSAIETYVNNAYNNWDIHQSAILLLGDYGTSGSTIISPSLSHPYSGTYVTDNIYADVDGDNLPDISFSRITAQNAADLEVMINKFINYEKQPPTSADYYNYPVTAMGWQTDRWFQLCSEVINGFLEHGLGKEPVRENAINSGTPGGVWSSADNTATVVDYFGTNGLNYIPDNSAHLTDWGGSATRINNDINSGAFMVQHRDHGGESGWGEPSYQTSNLSGLNNDKLSFIFSVNCLTGRFDWSSECFTEAFHRMDKGALGLIAASNVSYSFVNDVYVWGLYDGLWPDFMPDYGNSGPVNLLPSFANAYGKYFLQQSNWPYNSGSKLITYNLFHHHGDAFSVMYSEVPQNLTVNHDNVLLSGFNSFDVNADVNSFIALCVNGEIIGTAEGTGSSVSIPIIPQQPGNEMIVTVTKDNYYRYSQIVAVIPPNGPYVIKDSYVFDDENNNDTIDSGESVLLSLKVKNIGSEQGENIVVNISSEDPFFTLTDNTESYGNIPVGGTASVENGFAFDVYDSIPDDYPVSFIVSSTDGTDTWESNFSLKAYAPVLNIGSMSVNDGVGGNGNLDAGETADIYISAFNTGHSNAHNIIANIISSSEYLTINSANYTCESLVVEETIFADFNVSVSDDAPTGTVIPIIFTLNSGKYLVEKTFNSTVGIIYEDFETGDFTKFNWQNFGDSDWQINNNDVYESAYSAKSGSINNGESSILSISLDVVADGTISFYKKLSSEANNDFLEFYIDNSKVGSWSGEVDWSFESFDVTTGEHTFTWKYLKDNYSSSGEDCAWIDYIVFPTLNTAPKLSINNIVIIDTVSGNSNGRLDPGETIDLNFTVNNFGLSSAFNTYTILSTNNTNINIVNDTVLIGQIERNNSAEASLTISVNENSPTGIFADLFFDVFADSDVHSSDTIIESIGKIPALVVDFDKNNNSGIQIQSTIEELELSVDYLTALPEDLNLYKSIFICLGVYNNNNKLTDNQGDRLVEFLNNGGRLYMEGGDTWYYDTQTAAHNMFHISGLADGSNDLSTIDGQVASFTDGLSFAYSGDNNYIDHISANDTAVLIFKNQSPAYGTAVAFDGGIYKTIGASFEFAGLVDETTSTKKLLMQKYLEFFGLPPIPEKPLIPEGLTEVCGNVDTVSYSIAKVENASNYIWSITPDNAGSFFGNDTISYLIINKNFSGMVGISVKASNDSGVGEASDTLSVNILTAVSVTLSGDASICENDSSMLNVVLTGTPPWSVVLGSDETFVVNESPWNPWVKPLETKEYKIISVTDANGCFDDGIGSALISVFPNPIIDLGPDTAICSYLTYTIDAGSDYESYLWYNGSTEQIITVDTLGIGTGVLNLWVDVANANGCFSRDSLNINFKDCTGINDLIAPEINIYPNPNTGNFNLEIDAKKGVFNIKILNTFGINVYNLQNVFINGKYNRNINTKNLSDGVYILIIENNSDKYPEGRYLRKIIIQK